MIERTTENFGEELDNAMREFYEQIFQRQLPVSVRPRPVPEYSETTLLNKLRPLKDEDDFVPEQPTTPVGSAIGACCCPDDPSCFITTETSCIACCPVCTFYGAGSTCDPNPCGGACCIDGVCYDYLNEGACEAAGGTWKGVGVVCAPDLCACPTATLVCDSVSVTKSKCCAFTNPDDGKCYFTQTENFTNTPSSFCASGENCAHFPAGGCIDLTPSGDACPMRCITASVSTSYTTSTTSSADHDCNFADDVNNTEDIDIFYFTCCECIDELGNGCCSYCDNPDHTPEPTPPGPPPSPFWNVCTSVTHTSTGFTYSDEETDADLIAAAIAALPAFDGVYDDSCGATFDLEGTTVTIKRNKYKFTLSGPAPAGMTVDWDESGPDGVVHHTWTAGGGETETDVFEEDEPSTNGTTDTINIVTACP